MRGIVRSIRNLWLDWRTFRWLTRMRLELRRNGGKLHVEGWRGVRMLEQPRIRTNPLGGEGGGVTTIRLSPEVMIGYGVIVEIYARGNNQLRLDRGSRLYEGTRIELRGGSIRIGERTMIHDRAVLQSDGNLILGADCRISYGSSVHCSERVELGRYASVSESVTVTDSDHIADGGDTPIFANPIVRDPVLIESNVFVARGCAVLRGAHIGRNSVVGANSVVRGGEYPPGSLLAGTPAKLIRKLEPSEQLADPA
jgi:acetyltransferase-like isoleucine patch superfamily enzyme